MLSHDYPPYIFGGMGTFSHDLANALSRMGISVGVMAGCPAQALKTGLVQARTRVNKNLEVIRIPRMDLPPSRLWYQLMNLDKLRHLLTDFDIVHSQDQCSFPLICYCKKDNPRLPWVVTMHNDPVSELYYTIRSVASLESSMQDVLTNVVGFPLSDSAIRIEGRLADVIVPVSRELHKGIQDKYKVGEKKIFTIHNGVNVTELEKEAKVSADKRSETGIVNMFYAGRLYWRKGILHLIKSLAYMSLNFRFTEYRLEIFGEGPLRRTISSLISKFNLEKNVKLRGFVTRGELISAMATSDLVCVPSLYEACPIAMIEAMILGKPVVTFNRPFSQELLDGIPDVAMARTIQDYGSQLYSLCTSQDRRIELGRRLRTMAVERFDIERSAKKYIDVYRNLVP